MKRSDVDSIMILISIAITSICVAFEMYVAAIWFGAAIVLHINERYNDLRLEEIIRKHENEK